MEKTRDLTKSKDEIFRNKKYLYRNIYTMQSYKTNPLNTILQ